jgi:hypothetical protein
VLASQPPLTAAQGQSSDSSGTNHPANSGQSVNLSGPVQLFPEHAWLDTRSLARCINLDPLHQREIEHQTPENRDALKKKYADQKDVVHAYCVDFLPADSYYLRFDDGGDRVVIRLQASRELIALFEAALPRA